MRKNQITLTIRRFGDQVPKGYPMDGMDVKVYADSNNLYEALSKAYAKAINVMEEYERVGVRCDITTNADETISARLLNRRYNENSRLDYVDDCLDMDEKLLGYLERSHEIIDVIRQSTKENVRNNLMEKLGYSKSEVQDILRIHFGMMTAEDVENLKEDIARLKKVIEERNAARL